MTAKRHGGRSATILATLALCGCGADVTPGPATHPKIAAEPGAADSIPGPPSAVAEIVWDGEAAGLLAVLLSDGRFAIHRASPSPLPRRVVSPGGGLPARAIATLGPIRAVTGDASGLALWDTSTDPPRSIERISCGPVSAMARVVDEGGGPSLIVGRDDGRLLRFRLAGGDRLEPSIGTPEAGGAKVRRVVAIPGGREVVAIREDGSARRRRGDLLGPATDLEPCRGLSFDSGGGVTARLTGEARVEIGPPPVRRVSLPGASSLPILADRGRVLLVGVEGGCLLYPIPESGPISPLAALKVAGLAGTPVLAADPTDPQGRRLAVGDGHGRVNRIELGALMARGVALSLDDVPELAFEPHRRFGRSRPGSAPAPDPASDLGRRVSEARAKIELGETSGPAAILRDLDGSDAIDQAATGEIRALIAVAEGRGGLASASLLRTIERANEAFTRAGRTDRAADMEFWSGLLQARPFEPTSGRMPQSTGGAEAALRRAASLYRAADPPLPRQALLAEAASAWVALDLDDVGAAVDRFAPVAEAARTDPVLGQVVELDRIAAAIAMARGDPSRAEHSYARILARLRPGERPSLRREAAMGRALALSELGRAREAAEGLEPDDPKDPEWSLRRLSCRIAAGLIADPPRTADEDDPVAAHARALIARASPDPAPPAIEDDLTTAAEGHRHAGREDLALEADLGRAEVLERLGRWADAASLYATLLQALRALPDRDDVRRGERPILGLAGRAARGLARAEIAGGKGASALAALSSPTRGRPGTLGLTAAEFATAEDLFRKTRKLQALEAPGAEREHQALASEIRRLETALAGRRHAASADHPSAVLDAGGLGLGETEALLILEEVGPESMAGVLIRVGSEPVVARLPCLRSELTRRIVAWRLGLGDGGRPFPLSRPDVLGAFAGLGAEPDLPGRVAEEGRAGPPEARLHDALLGPFDARLEGVTRLFVVPGGVAGAVPIDVLGRDRRNLERFAISYLPEGGFLAPLRDDRRAEPAKTDRLLFVSPGAEREVRHWAVKCREARWRPEALVGPLARPDRLFALALWSYPSIHLAAPAKSLGTEDGVEFDLNGERLSPEELAGLPLRARALVLQPLGRGGISGEALRDLARVGLATGAGAVVLALWEPPEESARRFYAEYYRKLREGETPALAVDAARATVARDPKFRDPVHWAGYVVYGP